MRRYVAGGASVAARHARHQDYARKGREDQADCPPAIGAYLLKNQEVILHGPIGAGKTYSKVISDRGYPAITTRITLASEHTHFMVEDYHQQYLYKVPYGYRGNVTTKLALPELS